MKLLGIEKKEAKAPRGSSELPQGTVLRGRSSGHIYLVVKDGTVTRLIDLDEAKICTHTEDLTLYEIIPTESLLQMRV